MDQQNDLEQASLMPSPLTITICVYALTVGIMSVMSFIAYGVDKRQARRGGFRVSEKSLHLLALLGGWPGALLGQKLFRHKTQKRSFRVVFWIVLVAHLCIVLAVGYALFKWEQASPAS